MDCDAKHFVEAMKNNHTLISLDLSHNEFGELGGEYLGGAIVSLANLCAINGYSVPKSHSPQTQAEF